ncbi:MAG: RNA polymerase sigma factor (sigma-70 family) [Maribacter sp.]
MSTLILQPFLKGVCLYYQTNHHMAAECLNQKPKVMHDDIHAVLVKDCLSGDRKAQYRLYRLYSRAMFNTCLRMLKSREDAEDVLQNSFIDIFSKLHMFRGDSTIGAWIKRIVVNNCINFIKKKRIPLTDLDPVRMENIKEEEGLEDIKIDASKIQDALYLLPDGYRVVFSLYAIEGYDHAEIAEILGTSVSTSKSQYSRSKKRMREILKEKQNLIQNS